MAQDTASRRRKPEMKENPVAEFARLQFEDVTPSPARVQPAPVQAPAHAVQAPVVEDEAWRRLQNEPPRAQAPPEQLIPDAEDDATKCCICIEVNGRVCFIMMLKGFVSDHC